jgi:hypothetical protein
MNFSKTSPSEFAAARCRNSRTAYLTLYPAAELSQMDLFLSADKTAGYALKDNGELVNVFNNGPRGRGAAAVVDAVANGAGTLDCLGDGLAGFYAGLGFIETGRDAWNDEYAPDGWDYLKDGRPDVVYMAWRGAAAAAA